MRKLIMLILVLLIVGIAGLSGYFIHKKQDDNLTGLSPAEMHDKIIQERDYAISLAADRGDYRCCITPPCTMCYQEANRWNNYTAGTCACDDLVAQGKEACPQCEKGSPAGQSENNSVCGIAASPSSACDTGE